METNHPLKTFHFFMGLLPFLPYSDKPNLLSNYNNYPILVVHFYHLYKKDVKILYRLKKLCLYTDFLKSTYYLHKYLLSYC